MTAQALLETIKLHGIELKSENGKLYARPSLPENLKAEVKARKGEIVALLSTSSGLTLSQAYRSYWELPETEPIETFRAILAEIGILESQRNPAMVIGILEAEAQRFHRETGLCPYCRLAGPLHHGPERHEGNR